MVRVEERRVLLFFRALRKSDTGWEGPAAHSAASKTRLAGHSKPLKGTWD